MTLKKNIAIVLILTLLFSSFAGYAPIYGLEAEQTSVTVNIGCEGMNISLSGEDLPDNLSAVTDKDGNAEFDELYSYLNDTLQWGSGNVLPPESEVVEVSYDINYAEAATAEDRANKENGKAEFEGVKGTFTLKRTETVAGEGFVWTQPVTLDAPDQVTFVKGSVMVIPYGKEATEAEAIAGIKVKTVSDKGETVEVTTEEDGTFDFSPYAQTKNRDDVAIIVEGTEDYEAYEVDFKNFSGKILLTEKFAAVKDVDYQFDGPIKDGYINGVSNITVSGIGENKVCAEKYGEYTGYILLKTDTEGNLPGFYVKNANGDVSKEVNEALKMDGEAPVVTEVNEVGETQGEDILFREDGIYSKTDADLTLQITATDKGIGIDKIYLQGDNGEEQFTYEAEKVVNEDGAIKADFVIAAKENLAETLSVYVSDKFGNVSEMILIRGAGSILYIEDKAPVISDIVLDGIANSNNWYNDDVDIKFDAQDAESGLYSVKVTINGDEVYEESFPYITLDSMPFICPLETDKMNETDPKDGKFNVVVTATDRVGNETVKEISFKADAKVPVASLNGAENGKAYQKAPELTISTSEKMYEEEGAYIHVIAKKDGQAISSENFEKEKSIIFGTDFSEDGKYEVSAYAVDAAGNKSRTVTVSYIIDTTKPSVALDVDDAYLKWNNDDVPLTVTAEDSLSQIVYVEAFLGDVCLLKNLFDEDFPFAESVEKNFTLSKDVMKDYNSEDGRYEVVVKVKDAAGNMTEKSLVIKADLEAPDINIDGAEDGGIYQNLQSLVIETAEKFFDEEGALIHVTIEKDGEKRVNKDYEQVNKVTFEEMFYDNGTYTVTAYAQDAARNKSDEKKIIFVVDSVNPTITVDGYSAGSISDWKNSDTEVSFKVADTTTGVKQVETTINGVDVTTKSYGDAVSEDTLSFVLDSKFVKQNTAENGEYDVLIKTKDAAGNEAEYRFTIRADIVNPELSFRDIVDGKNYAAPPIFTIVNNDAHAEEADAYVQTEVKRNDEEAVIKKHDAASSVAMGSATDQDGIYKVSAFAVDPAGNRSEKISVSYIVDTVKPEILVDGLADGLFNGWKNDAVEVNFSVSDFTSGIRNVTATINGKTVVEEAQADILNDKAYSFILTKELIGELENNDGSYTVIITAEDHSGNLETKEFVIYADIVTPETKITGAENGKAYQKAPELTISTSDKYYAQKDAFIHVTVEKDGQVFFSDNYNGVNSVKVGKTYTENGTYKITVYTVDAAGNRSEEQSLQYIIDNVKPEIKVKGLAEGIFSTWKNDAVKVNFSCTDATSGLKGVNATVNGQSVISDTTEDYLTDKGYAFTLTKDMIAELENEHGTYVVNIETVDNAGNVQTVEFTIYADIVTPGMKVTGAQEGKAYSKAPEITVTTDEKYYAQEDAYIFVTVVKDSKEISSKAYHSESSVKIGGDYTENGFYTVTAYAVDAAGNRSEEKSLSYVIDDVNPEIKVDGLADGIFSTWKNDAVEVKFNCSDETSGLKEIKATVNGKSVIGETPAEYRTEAGCSFVLTKEMISELINEAGEYTVEIIVEDMAGNKKTESFVIKADIVNPDITVTGANEGQSYQKAPEITVSTSEKHYAEAEAYIHVTVKKDGKEITSEKFTSMNQVKLGSNYTENGFYEVTAYAMDAAGNKSAEKSLNYIIDDVIPEIMIPGVEENSFSTWKNSSVDVSFTVSDKTSGLKEVTATVNGKSVIGDAVSGYLTTKDYQFTLDKDMIEELINESGAYQVVITAKDISGTVASSEFTIKADIVTPGIKVEGAVSGKAYQKAPEITVSTDEKHYDEDGAFIMVSVLRDGKEISNKTYKSVNAVTLGTDFTENGVYEVKAYAQDAAGNKSKQQSLSYIVDNVNPTVAVPEHVNGEFSTWKNDKVDFTFELKDAVAGLKEVSVSINDSEVLKENYQASKETTHTVTLTKELITSLVNAEGKYTVVIKTVDMAGNTAKYSFEIKADIVSPSISIKGAVEKKEYQTPPELTITTDEKHYAEDGAFIQTVVTLDGKEISSRKFASVNAVKIGKDFNENGVYAVTAYAIDAAGNKSKVKSISYTVDNTVPTIEISGLKDGLFDNWTNKDTTVQFKADDKTAGLKSVTADINGKKLLEKDYDSAAYGKEYSITLTKALIKELDIDNGKYHVTITATDRAGNEYTKKMTIKADIVKPKIAISGVEKGTHYNYSPKVTITSNEKYYSEKGAYMVETIYLDGKQISSKTYKKENQIVNRKAFKKDGLIKITTYAVDAAGNKSDEKSISFMIDKKRPVVSIDGAMNGKTYAQAKTLTFSVDEKNFKSNDVTIKVTRTLGRNSENIPVSWKSTGEHSTVSKTFSATGTYTVTMTATDKAGNEAYSKSLTFTVDQAAPVITIGGVEENRTYTYDNTLAPSVNITDDYFGSKSVTVTKDGSNVTSSVGISDNGTRVSVTNIPKSRDFDGRYTLTVSAIDKAGNSSEKKVSFVVNRFGSEFSANKSLMDLNNTYVQTLDGDIVITERNLSETSDIIFDVTRDGESLNITPETTRTTSGGYYEYIHTISEEEFNIEGAYQINIISTDAAGNVSEFTQTAGTIKFFVDRTPPIINASGIGETFIQGTTHPIMITTTDNLSNATVEVTVDGKKIDLTEAEGVLTFVLDEGFSQKVVIKATDAAGNVETIEQSITVSTSGLVFVFAQYGIYIAIATLIAAAAVAYILIRKKSRTPEKEKNKK